MRLVYFIHQPPVSRVLINVTGSYPANTQLSLPVRALDGNQLAERACYLAVPRWYFWCPGSPRVSRMAPVPFASGNATDGQLFLE